TTGRQRCAVRTNFDHPLNRVNGQGTRLILARDRERNRWSDFDWEVWDVSAAPARKIGTIDRGPLGATIEFSPDGRWLCLQRGTPSEFELWDTETLRQVTLPFHPSLGFWFSPDSQFLVAWDEPDPPGRRAWLMELFGRKPPPERKQVLRM